MINRFVRASTTVDNTKIITKYRLKSRRVLDDFRWPLNLCKRAWIEPITVDKTFVTDVEKKKLNKKLHSLLATKKLSCPSFVYSCVLHSMYVCMSNVFRFLRFDGPIPFSIVLFVSNVVPAAKRRIILTFDPNL